MANSGLQAEKSLGESFKNASRERFLGPHAQEADPGCWDWGQGKIHKPCRVLTEEVAQDQLQETMDFSAKSSSFSLAFHSPTNNYHPGDTRDSSPLP